MQIYFVKEDFYRYKIGWMPDDLKKEIGHFNILRSIKRLSKRRQPFYNFYLQNTNFDSLSEQISQKPRFVKLYLCHSSIRHQDSGHYQVFRYGL